MIRALISLALLSAPALAEDLADPVSLNPLVIEQCLAADPNHRGAQSNLQKVRAKQTPA